MITSTKGSPNNIIHPTRARNTGFGKENFGRVMMSVDVAKPSVQGLLVDSQGFWVQWGKEVSHVSPY
jgi:hypothetical protein